MYYSIYLDYDTPYTCATYFVVGCLFISISGHSLLCVFNDRPTLSAECIAQVDSIELRMIGNRHIIGYQTVMKMSAM